jgi:hypothetical protein
MKIKFHSNILKRKSFCLRRPSPYGTQDLKSRYGSLDPVYGTYNWSREDLLVLLSYHPLLCCITYYFYCRSNLICFPCIIFIFIFLNPHINISVHSSLSTDGYLPIQILLTSSVLFPFPPIDPPAFCPPPPSPILLF